MSLIIYIHYMQINIYIVSPDFMANFIASLFIAYSETLLLIKKFSSFLYVKVSQDLEWTMCERYNLISAQRHLRREGR